MDRALFFVPHAGWTAWVGTVVVVENVVSSLAHSHLFDFTHGWLYVFGVGVAGGMMLRQSTQQQSGAHHSREVTTRPVNARLIGI